MVGSGETSPNCGALWSPWLLLVGEPDELGVERTDPELAFGVWLVELAEPDRHVATDDVC